MSNMTRKSFVRLAVLSAAVIVSLCSCKKSATTVDAGPDAPAGCTLTDATVMIADNHPHAPHALVVPSADVQAGVEKVYDIMGVAAHTHTITVTAADFATLKAGGTIMETSTTALDHSHVITISCG
jgi:hypothetical protein